MQPEEISLKSNFELEARLWNLNSKRGIVAAHSFRNSMDEPVIVEAADYFAEGGYQVLSFNFLGHGKSGGRLRDVSYRTVSDNVTSAIQVLHRNGCKRVGVYAISLGTIASVLSTRPNAQVLLNPSPLYNPRGALERYASSIDRKHLVEHGYTNVESGSGRGSFEMGKAWIDEMENDPDKAFSLHMSRAIPTLIIQGGKDPLATKEIVRSFVNRTGDTYIEIPEGDHNFNRQEDRDEVFVHSLSWFDRKLC